MKRENLKITLTVKGHEPVHTTSDDLARMVESTQGAAQSAGCRESR